ncbi:MAG: hypothetical protein ACXWUE_30230 [Polyangiales bacterium]
MRVLILFSILAACSKERPVLERYPLRTHVRWTETIDQNGAIRVRKREELWTKSAGQKNTWDVVTTDVGGANAYHARYALTEQGLAQTAIFDCGTEVAVEPPKITLPASPKPGNAWKSWHLSGTAKYLRACDIAKQEGCEGGIVVHCTATYGDGRIVDVKNKFCAGVGQVSYESTTVKQGSDDKIHIISEDLVDVP